MGTGGTYVCCRCTGTVCRSPVDTTWNKDVLWISATFWMNVHDMAVPGFGIWDDKLLV